MRLVLVPDAARTKELGTDTPTGALNVAALAKALGIQPVAAWEKGGRVSISLGDMLARFEEIPLGTAHPTLNRGDGFEMGVRTLEVGLPAALDALDDVVAVTEARPEGTNWLSFIGARISLAVRRAVLLYWLRALNWNMQHVGEVLGLGGTQGVIRAIKDLGGEVATAYEQARKDGLITAGGRRPRAPVANDP